MADKSFTTTHKWRSEGLGESEAILREDSIQEPWSSPPPPRHPPPPPCRRSPTASPPCVCNRSILSFCCSFSHPPSLAPCAARGLSDQSSRTPDRKERKANSASKKRRRSPSPPSTPAESRKKGGKKGWGGQSLIFLFIARGRAWKDQKQKMCWRTSLPCLWHSAPVPLVPTENVS